MQSRQFDVGAAKELENGEMKEVEAEGRKILLARVDGKLYATSGECPHYGASLAEGLLCGARVVCPWHKAVFCVTNGELLEPPAREGLEHYEVAVKEGRVLIQLGATKAKATPEKQGEDARCFVLAGAGGACAAAAEHLRRLDFSGRVVMLSGETEAPYDRTKLSKEFLSGNAAEGALALRETEYWENHRIEVVRRQVQEVKTVAHQVVLSDGSSLGYDRLLLATGSEAQKLEVAGSELGNVFTLRSEADAKRILAATTPGVRAVIVGGSFIGMEVASCFAIRQIPVTVIVKEDVPFRKQLGAEVGRIFQRWHESHGVVFRLQAEVERLTGMGVVRGVVLKSGEEMPADVVVAGMGVQPATGFAGDFSRREDGGIVVDERLGAAQDVYAAGDIAVFPESYSTDTARIEHWRIAEQQGRTAAENMLGRKEAFAGVPYFWTNHFGTRFDYVGHAKDWDEVILKEGDKFPTFLAFYVSGRRVVAASACQRDREMAAFHELMRMRQVPTLKQLSEGADLVALAEKAGAMQQAKHVSSG